ncbi:hypothetical protein [Streptomyces sp. NPDC014733]|uniref:hypothetical protein n=1 Tax=Streptomyces sp. NPDC014733 TaxID=3364885 RepID=UPI0036F9B391
MTSDQKKWTQGLRARGRRARQRLELGWKPCGRTVVEEGPAALVSMVEVAALALALDLVEQAAQPPEGLARTTALGWRAGAGATVEALRAALEHQAGLLPPPPPPRPRRESLPLAAPEEMAEGALCVRGVDWSQA